MAMNPDIKDPAWIKLREAQWKTLEAFLKGDIRRAELAQWRKVFFGEEEFVFGDKRKYPGNPYNIFMGFVVWPIQTTERWLYLFQEQYPKWWPTEKILMQYLPELIQTLSNMSLDLNRWGWDVDTQVHLHRFMVGEHYVDGVYYIAGYALKYPYRASAIHRQWLSQIYFWLCGSILYPDTRERHLIGYWMSCLEYLHPWFFEPRLVRNYGVQLPQMRLKSLMAYCVNYDVEAIKAQCLLEKGRELIDGGERQAFLDEIRSIFETADLPVAMKRLWQMAKEDTTFGAESHGLMPENEDPSLLLDDDEFKRTILT